MATFAKVVDFLEGMPEGEHDFTVNTLELAFSNTAPASETNNPLTTSFGAIANVTQIAYTNWTDDATGDRVFGQGFALVNGDGSEEARSEELQPQE